HSFPARKWRPAGYCWPARWATDRLSDRPPRTISTALALGCQQFAGDPAPGWGVRLSLAAAAGAIHRGGAAIGASAGDVPARTVPAPTDRRLRCRARGRGRRIVVAGCATLPADAHQRWRGGG